MLPHVFLQVVNMHTQAEMKNSGSTNDVGTGSAGIGVDAAGGVNTPIMDPTMIKQETFSSQLTPGRDSQQLGGIASISAAQQAGPWTLVGGMTVMENSKVKVEMMETCSNITTFSVPATFSADT